MLIRSDYKSPTFGLALEADPQYGQTYVLDINRKSSTAHLFSSLKTTRKAIRLSYIVEFAGDPVFSKSETSTALEKNCAIRGLSILYYISR